MTRLELLNYNLDMMLEHDDYDPYAEAEEEVSGGIWGHFKNNKKKYIAGAIALVTGFIFRKPLKMGGNALKIRLYQRKHPEVFKALKAKETELDSTKTALDYMEKLSNFGKNGDKAGVKDTLKQYSEWVLKEYQSVPGTEQAPGLTKLLAKMSTDATETALKLVGIAT